MSNCEASGTPTTQNQQHYPTEPVPAPTVPPTPVPPTPDPTPSPLSAPTYSPTFGTTSSPTSSPTLIPTPIPTDDLTPQPIPTPAPTDVSSPNPSSPTQSPSCNFCNINYSLDLIIVVSNGCGLTSDECDSMREYMSDLVKKMYNPRQTQLRVVV